MKQSMANDVLKMLIQLACSDGELADQELEYIKKYADTWGVDDNELVMLLSDELSKVNTTNTVNKTQNQSGFNITDKQIKNNILSGFHTLSNNKEKQSGFATKENITDNASGFISPDNKTHTSHNQQYSNVFTDVKTLVTNGSMSIIQKGKYYGKWVIIKRIREDKRQNLQYNDLFFKEFENAYHLDHPNIVRINGKGNDSAGIYYFMEYVDGRTLSKEINKRGILDGLLIVKIVIEILQALEYVHKKQIYHRDLKPENIMLTYKGENVKLLDFGLAAADNFDENLKNVGTPKYAAPEQKYNPNIVDGRSDIYSFGLIFMEMLTGQCDDIELVKQRSVSAYFVIHKCLEKKMDKRFDNCTEVIKDLKGLRIKSKLVAQPKPKTIEKQTVELVDTLKQQLPDSLLPVVTLKDFFQYTYKVWMSDKLKNFIPAYSLEQSFKAQAGNTTYYELLLKNNDEVLQKIFQYSHFFRGEYLLQNDKRVLLLTNYRLFLRSSSSASFDLYPLDELVLNERVEIVDRIYVKFKKYKIWKKDWDLVVKIANCKEWKNIEQKYRKLLSLDAKHTNEYLAGQNIKINSNDFELNKDIYHIHVTIDDFIDYTKKIYLSDKLIQFYDNCYYNHFPAIESEKELITDVFDFYYPLKNEYLLLDRFYENGFVTNYRIFYIINENNEQAYRAISLEVVEEIKINISTNNLEINQLFADTIIIPCRKAILTELSDYKIRLKRLNKIIKLKEWQSINPKLRQFIEANKNDSNMLWEEL